MKRKAVIIIICILVAAIAAGGIFLLVRNHQKSGNQTQQSNITKSTVKVACIGDSITYGYTLQKREETAYPAQLQSLLGSGYKVVNYGITGRTVALSGDFPYALEDAYEKSKAFTPDIVLLMLGTNDTKKANWNKEQFENDYAFIVEGYRGLPNRPQVYVMTPPPLYFEGGNNDAPDKNVLEKEVVPFIRAFARKEQLPLIDVYKAFEGKPQWLSDGCHLNEEGAKQLATLVYQTIAKQ
ncbi:MAG: hypothetical protein IJI67_01940 [Clostridia bacterium]|nr:hypothetical protein [Clostridia bacterium]